EVARRKAQGLPAEGKLPERQVVETAEAPPKPVAERSWIVDPPGELVRERAGPAHDLEILFDQTAPLPVARNAPHEVVEPTAKVIEAAAAIIQPAIQTLPPDARPGAAAGAATERRGQRGALVPVVDRTAIRR